MSKNHEHQPSKQLDVLPGVYQDLVKKLVERDLPTLRWGYAVDILTNDHNLSLWQQGAFTVAILYGIHSSMVKGVGVAKRNPCDHETNTGTVLAISRAIRSLIIEYIE